MWRNKTVAVIFPALSEISSIREAILDFDSTGFIDEIIVVDNDLPEDTLNKIVGTRARIIKEKRHGFGLSIQTGIKATGAFAGKDVTKLLAYSDDFETVFGSRTHVPLIKSGSGMNFLRRVVDVLYGKLVSLLFLCGPLTDLGCTLKITSRMVWRKVAGECRAKSALFTTEWILLAAKNKVRFCQIPVNFKSGVGGSLWSENFLSQVARAIVIFFYIFRVWFSKRLGRRL